MDEYIRNLVMTALVFTGVGWARHRHAVRKAEDRGEDPPGMWDLAWQLIVPVAALGIGYAAGLTYLTVMFVPGPDWSGLFHIVGAYVVGFIAAGMAWLLLAVLGAAGGPGVQVVLLVVAAVVVLVGLRPLLGESMPGEAKAESRMLGYRHAPEGVVPWLLNVSSEGELLRVGNRTEQALFVVARRVLRQEGRGYERCPMGVEQNDRVFNFRPEVAYAQAVMFTFKCDPRFRDAPVEYSIFDWQGKTLFMSDSAFLP